MNMLANIQSSTTFKHQSINLQTPNIKDKIQVLIKIKQVSLNQALGF